MCLKVKHNHNVKYFPDGDIQLYYEQNTLHVFSSHVLSNDSKRELFSAESSKANRNKTGLYETKVKMSNIPTSLIIYRDFFSTSAKIH